MPIQPERENQSGSRLFVAIEASEEVKAALAALRFRLPDLKWTPPGNLHLTLRFIGPVPQAKAEATQQALRRVRLTSFRLTVAGLGLFSRKTGGILWAGVEKEPVLSELKRRVDEALRGPAGLTPPDDSFSPHITLSRLKKTASPEVKTLVREKEAERFGGIPVTAFTLFRSLTLQSGAVHEPVETYPLHAPGND